MDEAVDSGVCVGVITRKEHEEAWRGWLQKEPPSARPRNNSYEHMEPGIDTGPVAYQELFDIEDADTGLTLSARCIRSGITLVLRLMETALNDPAAIPLTP